MAPRKDLKPIIAKVRNLLDLTRTTGFQTSRSIGALLADLTPDELSEVWEGIKNPSQQLSQR